MFPASIHRWLTAPSWKENRREEDRTACLKALSSSLCCGPGEENRKH